MRNAYPGVCADCSKHVPASKGYFERRARRFVVRCMECVVAGKVAAGKPLSDAQRAALEGQTP